MPIIKAHLKNPTIYNFFQHVKSDKSLTELKEWLMSYARGMTLNLTTSCDKESIIIDGEDSLEEEYSIKLCVNQYLFIDNIQDRVIIYTEEEFNKTFCIAKPIIN